MFDIQISPSRAALLNDISPKGSWENQWYALLTQTLQNGEMKVCREQKKFNVSSTRGRMKNSCNPQKVCSNSTDKSYPTRKAR